MLRQPRRLVSAAVAIVLGVAFVAASLLLGATFDRTLADAAAGTIGDAAVVLTPDRRTEAGDAATSFVSLAVVDAVRTLPGVTGVRGAADSLAVVNGGPLQLRTLPALTATTTLKAGRLPAASGDVALSTVAADALGKGIGETVALPPVANGPRQVTIVGIVAAGTDAVPTPGMGYLFATDADVFAWSGQTGYEELLVFGASQQALRDAAAHLPAVVADRLVVRTGDAERADRVNQMLGSAQGLVVGLLAFAAIALFVSSQVIANTFSILVAQRARQLALLRCVGASRRQVFGSVLGEAALLGLVASVLGVGVGAGLVGLAILASRGTPMALGGLVVTPAAVGVPLGVGVLVTVASALLPAWQATRVPPLAALRTGAVSASQRPGRVRLALGVLGLLAGLPALVVGALGWPGTESRIGPFPANLAVGMAGGLVSVLGVLALTAVLVPAVARVLGPLARALGGLPGQLASDNAIRNPKRAAATASALLVGVTLITMMSVSMASTQATMSTRLDGRFPVDASVTGSERTIDPAITSAVAGVRGVARTAVVPIAPLTHLDLGGGTSQEVALLGISPDAAALTHDTTFAAGLADDTIVLPGSLKIPAGTLLPVSTMDAAGAPGATVKLRVVVAAAGSTPPMVTPATLGRLTATPASVLWVRFADGADAYATAMAVGKAATAASPNAVVEAAAIQRQELTKAMDAVLAVVVGLLAVAVVIALVGIGNTLGLSVLERSQESGLLRALGLTKAELRRSIGIEAVLLAGVAVVLGLALGLGYGVAGTYALIGAQTQVVVDVPWLRLALAAAVALLAGWAASVLPAFRAARVSPAAAMVAE